MSMYGVTQMNHGAEHRWIFSEEELSRELYDGDPVPDKVYDIPFWPIGGSNCGYSNATKLNTDEEIREFLTAPGLGADLEDPCLVDLAEYYCEADAYNDWCQVSSTRAEMERLGISFAETQSNDSRYDEAIKMIEKLRKNGYSDFDYDNPFYGENRNMRFSELCDKYEEIKKGRQRNYKSPGGELKYENNK